MAAALLAYATLMDQNKGKKFGLLGMERVTVDGAQRFFGIPDPSLVGRSLEDLFDKQGNLVVADVGATTVGQREGAWFDAVLYTRVSADALANLDAVEARSHLVRTTLEKLGHNCSIQAYDKILRVEEKPSPVYLYVAQESVVVKGVGVVQLPHPDVVPNRGYTADFRRAAGVHGEEFLKRVEYSTFLADKETRLINSRY